MLRFVPTLIPPRTASLAVGSSYLLASSEIPSSLALSSLDIKPSADAETIGYVVSFAEIVYFLLEASGVRVTLFPATTVILSVFEVAAISVVPTVILLYAFWLTSAPAATPSNFDLSAELIKPFAVEVAVSSPAF